MNIVRILFYHIFLDLYILFLKIFSKKITNRLPADNFSAKTVSYKLTIKGRSNFTNAVVTYPSKNETTQNIVRHMSENKKYVPILDFSFLSCSSEKQDENEQNAINVGR